MSPVDLIARLRHFSKLLGGKDLPEIMSEAADSLASKDTALAEIRAELEHARKTAGRIFEEHMALIEERNALADCLNCARMDWEGNNGEIIDKSDPHWTVEARRLCASHAISQGGTLMSAPASRMMCETCQGNGEIVTDWDRYLGPALPGDKGDEGTEECVDCNGVGWLEAPVSTSTHEGGTK